MTQAALRQWFYAQLSGVYAQEELQTMYHWCTSEIHGWSRAEVYSRNDEELEETDLNRWKLVTNRLTNSEPIQYIFEKAPFFDFELFVDENVLIPRPETEELVQLLLDENLDKDTRVLDIGTGSGCIALAVKNERSHWRVSGCDISEGVLSIARKNNALLELDVNFFHADASQMETLSDVDLIISNPPYIPIDRKESLETNVLDHEPTFGTIQSRKRSLLLLQSYHPIGTRLRGEEGLFRNTRHGNGRADCGLEIDLVRDHSHCKRPWRKRAICDFGKVIWDQDHILNFERELRSKRD